VPSTVPEPSASSAALPDLARTGRRWQGGRVRARQHRADQQLLEVLRREGGIWATDHIERFVVSHGLLDQANAGAPRGR
jgi:hypothetical protein